jgi:biopolymer transport protein ExbD
MRFPHNTKIFRGQLDAAPFVGVFFLLVIFLLLNSGLVLTPGVPIHLPEGANLPGLEKASLTVAIDQSGSFYFNNQLCDEARLKERLQAAVEQRREPVVLLLKMDKGARVDALVRLSLLARSLGIREVVPAVQPPLVPAVSARQ